jgi:hypothetical protein
MLSVPNALGELCLLLDSNIPILKAKVAKLFASICCVSEETHGYHGHSIIFITILQGMSSPV